MEYKVKFKPENREVQEKADELLTEEEIEKNYHIACLTYPKSDLVFEIPDESRLSEHQIVNTELYIGEKKNRVKKFAGIAIDIGTTTV